MPRTVIKPLYPDDPEYMKIYEKWGQDTEAAYQEFSQWCSDVGTFIADIRRLASGLADQVRCNQLSFKKQAQSVISANRAWVDSIKQWLENIRVKLPDDKKVTELKEWDDWYAALTVWMDAQEQWYAAVYASLTTLASNVESQLVSFASTFAAWHQKMVDWKNSWPTTV